MAAIAEDSPSDATAPPRQLRITAPDRVDLTTAHGFRLDLRAALDSADRVDVDLSRVQALEAAGVAVLVGSARQAQAGGRRLRLLGASPAVTATLTRHHLHRWLHHMVDPGR